ncbi:hypothetical protein RRF57_005442 [Xylaria bambusicola]|uniref:Uncharacterized protein n=1 Tax=Xylaria bambusicola TaxID=326684 RepID=A0AAN7UJW6_9PEZI
MELPDTMNAVVFDGPYKVSLQQRPVPKSKRAYSSLRCSISSHVPCLLTCHVVPRALPCKRKKGSLQSDDDIVVKVLAAGLCGSYVSNSLHPSASIVDDAAMEISIDS